MASLSDLAPAPPLPSRQLILASIYLVHRGRKIKRAGRQLDILAVLQPERYQRGGPWWLLELRWMATQGVQMKGVLSLLVRRACRAGTRDCRCALAALVRPVQNIFRSPYTISIPFSPSPSKLGRQSCAGSPVSQYVSLKLADGEGGGYGQSISTKRGLSVLSFSRSSMLYAVLVFSGNERSLQF